MNDSSSDRSVGSDRSDGLRRRRLRPSGGYRRLRSFQTATVIYDATVSFCDRFVDKHSRTRDQMVQAARSGRQNIAEGSRASAASSQTELRLVNVARASLEELLLDYEDFLRQRGFRLWAKDDAEAKEVREVGKGLPTDPTDPTDPTRADAARRAVYAPWLDHGAPAVVANAVICLIHQANFLLDRQIAELETSFVQEGGYSEQLAAARIRQKKKRASAGPQGAAAPSCPLCGEPMALRTARRGKNAGSKFWGCCGCPDCKGTRDAE
jgi:restriction system protein